MQLDLSAIYRREEILTQARQWPDRKGKQRGGRHRAEKNGRKSRAALECHVQKLAVDRAHALKTLLEAILNAPERAACAIVRSQVMCLEPVLGEGRHQRS